MVGTHPDACGFDLRDHGRSLYFDAEVPQLLFRALRKIRSIRRQNSRASLEQNDAGHLRIDRGEFVGQYLVRDLRQCSGKLNARWTTAYDHEVQRKMRFATESLLLSQFKSKQYAAADLEGIFDGLQAGRVRLPIIVAKVGMAGSGGDDEVVIRHIEIGQADDAICEVKVLYLAEQHFNIVVVANDPADRRSNLPRRNSGGRYLIEQGLESMVVAAVNKRDTHRQMRELSGGCKATEPGAHDHNARNGSIRHANASKKFGSTQSLRSRVASHGLD